MQVLLTHFKPLAQTPEYKTSGSAGVDLYSAMYAIIPPGTRKLIDTGLKMSIPEGYEGQIRPRSGLAADNGVTVLNPPGTIDSDYRGEIKVLLINHGDYQVEINIGERIAQMVFNKVEHAEFIVVASLDDTDRGEGGFGSTGKI